MLGAVNPSISQLLDHFGYTDRSNMTEAARSACLIFGPELHHLDHLAPLCVLMDIPLIVTEERIALLAGRYYPHLKVILRDTLSLPEYLVLHFEVLFYSMPRDIFDEIFFFAQKMLQKRVRTIWCPHGNSDKGASIFYMEALKKEEASLLYGKQMIDALQRKGAYDQLKGHVITGNFRYAFYLSHRDFYDSLVQQEVFRKLPKAEKTLLYSPTWQDYEENSSFFDAIKPVVETLPSTDNLIVKLHPNLLLQEEFQVEEIIATYADRNNLLFLIDFTPIHPLLSRVDAYIGDMSSIGYDFLAFNKPMFFLSQTRSNPYLFRCGVEIPKENYGSIHQTISNYFHYELRDFSKIRQEVYAYAFGYPKPLETLKEEILKLISSFPKNELDFF
jgi:teichoic acid glycerol-phosphate primase